MPGTHSRFLAAVSCALLVGCSQSAPKTSPQLGTSQQGLNQSITFAFPNFPSASLLQLNGSASVSGNSVLITPSGGSQAGSFFCTQKVSLQNNRSFSTYFQMRMTNPGGGGADGLVFVIQPNSNTAGSLGGGLGYQGITNSFGVEFDSYQNAAPFNDPDNHHLGTHTNGNMNGHLAVASNPTLWSDGATYNVWIDYNGLTQGLEVRVNRNSNVRPASPVLTQTIDLSSVFGVDQVYAGFTAATGGAWEA
ncbi:MAG TPA: L-type lectin-domain containing protein, partial [Myxococcaceae bacterium]|nr:L-type lectin-domain containing protein [Myxococcaceae bacterium]